MNAPPPTEHRISPEVAAALGALAGIASCTYATFTIDLWRSPVVGVVVALVIYRVLIGIGARAAPADAVPTRARRTPWRAAAIAFAVCTTAAGLFGYAVKANLPGDTDPIIEVALAFGAILGALVAMGVLLLGRGPR